MGSFSIWHWIIVLVIILLVFGTKRLTGGAKDLSSAVKEFKKGMRDDDAPPPRIGESASESARQDHDAGQRTGSTTDDNRHA